MDHYAVLWTRTALGPVKMGNLLANYRETRFSYDPNYVTHTDAPGVSLLIQPVTWAADPYIHYTGEALPFPPRLMALVPEHNLNNVQRWYHSRLINSERRHPGGASRFELEWELLMRAGHGGIGHIDIFADDRKAETAYAINRDTTHSVGSLSMLLQLFRKNRRDMASDIGAMAHLLGPLPSVEGMNPKLLVAIPDSKRWDGLFAAPDIRQVGTEHFTDVVLKIEDARYPGVLALEALCYAVHRELGFETPRTWYREIDGFPVLAVERFDRDVNGHPIPMESFFSVYATGNSEVNWADDAMMEDVAYMLVRLGELTQLDAAKASLAQLSGFAPVKLTTY